jgi:uncharacterized phosphosugar-binding protein
MRNITKQYLTAVSEIINKIAHEEQESIDKAADVLADFVLKDKLINVFGPGGHSNLAAEEVLWRAGGLACVNPILDPGTSLFFGAKRSNYVERTPGYAKAVFDTYGVHEGDVLVIVNAYGINSVTIDSALECKKRGVTSIAITSKSFGEHVPKGAASRHPSGQNLYEVADMYINCHLPLGDSVVDVEGITPQKMGATSTYANAFAMNLLMMTTAEKLVERGVRPPVWTSANLPDGDRLNKEYEEKYGYRVRHLN